MAPAPVGACGAAGAGVDTAGADTVGELAGAFGDQAAESASEKTVTTPRTPSATKPPNTSLLVLMDYFWAALGSSAVAIAVASVFVLLVTSLLPFRVSDVVIAFAPGAQDTMMVLALALHLDPVYVGAHHLTRFLVVTFSVAIAARRLARQQGKPPRERSKQSGKGTSED